jgi:hypothetical protein
VKETDKFGSSGVDRRTIGKWVWRGTDWDMLAQDMGK